MEVLKGNLLILITFAGMFAFAVLCGFVYPARLRWRFCFYRKENKRYERKRLGSLWLGCSLFSIIVYKIVITVFQIQSVSFWGYLYPFVAIFFLYLLISFVLKTGSVKNVMLVCVCIFLLPLFVSITALSAGIKLDGYSSLLFVIMLCADLFFGIEHYVHWKKGDIFL